MFVDGTQGEPDPESLRLLEGPGMIDFSVKRSDDDWEEDETDVLYEPYMNKRSADGIHIYEDQVAVKHIQSVMASPEKDGPVEVSKVAENLGISDPGVMAMYVKPSRPEFDEDAVVAVPEVLWESVVQALTAGNLPGGEVLVAPSLFGGEGRKRVQGGAGVALGLPVAPSLLVALAGHVEDSAKTEAAEGEDAQGDLAVAMSLGAKLRAAAESKVGREAVRLVLSEAELRMLIWEVAVMAAGDRELVSEDEDEYDVAEELQELEELQRRIAKAAVREVERRVSKETEGEDW
jgi:hypothetical protein